MGGRSRRRCVFNLPVLVVLAWAIAVPATQAQSSPPTGSGDPLALYHALAAFDLAGGSAQAKNVVLKRDRAEISFEGTFYFETPIDGKIRGAVFIGKGTVHAPAPDSVFEKDNLQRMLHADAVDSDFKTAVLRFSDDSIAAMKLTVVPGGAPPEQAVKLAAESSPRLLKETGANVAARIAASILNNETPGFFYAEFDKGSRGRFSFILDYQGRLPTANFELDGGEDGLFYAFDSDIEYPDIWMAFFSLADYQNRIVEYSDAHAEVNISRYDMDVDVRDWKHMKLEARMKMTALADGVRAIPLMINETLSAADNARLKKAMRLESARMADGSAIAAVQEDWEGNVTLFLSAPLAKGQVIEPVLDFQGDFLIGLPTGDLPARYVRADCWYPRHENLSRAQFDMIFHHKKGTRVASVGEKVRELETPDHDMLTEWRMDQPVDLVTFAVGSFDVFNAKAKMENGGDLELDYYRVHDPGAFSNAAVKTDFMLAEMSNCVRYFSAIFGAYPYSRFGAAYHPFPFGQGFPTLLMLPRSDLSSKYTYSFIAHETSHEWWGDLVQWRSYRDQWLSEGFADYSGVLYTETRDKDRSSARDLLREMHDELLEPPQTLTGVGKGRLVDIGPIILGHRLTTRESFGAYQTLIYKKGALVLRMLQFLFTDPSTGNSEAFLDMMKDFVARYANRSASTEDFEAVANEHFLTTPLARQYQLKNLDWFFQQWVYESALPSYQLSYSVEPQRDGSAIVHCDVSQQNVPPQWLMFLPIRLTFGKNKSAWGAVAAYGTDRRMNFHVPTAPDSVELDPDRWILSDKTTTVRLPNAP
ncbi:MAG TPA: M1 family aminopeptidase [Verrucomicrobiae bacterium]|nr:M1 family aminopeptidase [Verrucomicrobiae bacterium]